MQNKAGKYVAPSPTTFAAAAANADWKKASDLVVSLINQPGDTSWPITTPSYVQVPLAPKDAARSLAVRKFFDFAFSKGGAAVTDSNLVPLPPAAQEAARVMWGKVGG